LCKGSERFVKNESDIIEEEIDKLDEEVEIDAISSQLKNTLWMVWYIPSLRCEIFPVYRIRPYALDDLENLVTNIEFVVKLSVRAGALTLIVKLH